MENLTTTNSQQPYAYQLLKNEVVWLIEVIRHKQNEENPSQIEINELEEKIMSLNVALRKIVD